MRKSLATQLEKQKKVAEDAKAEAQLKTQQMEDVSGQLAKYLSPQIYESIFSGKQNVEVKSYRKKITVFFSDIVNFTAISDKLESEELTALLNFYLNEMSQIALKHGATIDKYIGDAIMIFFGDPESFGIEEDARRCVAMAVEMQQRMAELWGYWSKHFGLKKIWKSALGSIPDIAPWAISAVKTDLIIPWLALQLIWPRVWKALQRHQEYWSLRKPIFK